MTDELDPGAYIGHEPELESETIPGGVDPKDERNSAYDSRPGVDGEPEGDAPDGPVGSDGGETTFDDPTG